MTNGKKDPNLSEDKGKEQEKKWEEPKDPEHAKDQRDIEQLLRQKKEAERRKDNLTDEETKI